MIRDELRVREERLRLRSESRGTETDGMKRRKRHIYQNKEVKSECGGTGRERDTETEKNIQDSTDIFGKAL